MTSHECTSQNNRNSKARKGCLSTHYRTNSRDNGSSKERNSSSVLNGSIMDNEFNSSVMEINEFNATAKSFIQYNLQG